MTRLDGIAWTDAALSSSDQARIAHQLGRVIRQLHTVSPPSDPVWDRDWLAEHRATCVQRQRQWGVLPSRLIEQIEAYLAPPSPERRLVHADLHDHHIFVRQPVEGADLVGIVDWGDALLTDPYYELPALHLHTFRGDRRLLGAFLDGYGWPVGLDFAHRAMTMTLLYEFNVLDGVRTLVDLEAVTSLSELATRLWTPV
jgi:aminoglycoside phosphotransferase (APT) family kinase protein